MPTPDRPAVGIDFGTTTSFLSKQAAQRGVDLLPLGATRRFLPSLAGRRFDELIAGEDALTLPVDRIIRSVKRAITEDRPTVRVGGRHGDEEVPRDDVVVAILKEIAKSARAKGEPLHKDTPLRLGCPAMWTATERDLLLQLAAKAGLPAKHARIVEEPVAAGISWLNSNTTDTDAVEGRLLVFDMGGGTLDIAVMQVLGGRHPEITVLTSLAVPQAGDVLDETIVEDLRTELDIDIDDLKNPMQARSALLRAATDTKVSLSVAAHTPVLLTARMFDRQKLPRVRYSRDRLIEVFSPQMDAAEELVWHALRLARLTRFRASDERGPSRLGPDQLSRDVDYILLAGGMSRIPYVRQRLAALFPKAEIFQDVGFQADETIVAGLVNATEYNTINMYRPGIDFELTWLGEKRRLYTAYSPLFSLAQIQTGQSRAGYRCRVNGLPRHGQADLVIRTANGEPVKIRHTAMTKIPRKETVGLLPVRFGHHDVHFTFYCDGRVHLTDGAGHDHELRIEGWPIIRD